jgi:hypothetical protein
MRLINISEGIEINYNNNESNIETIFGLNDDNSIIQKFTFPCDIYPNYSKLNNHILQSSNIELDNGFLFYSFRYQVSFAHFMCQTLPKLKDYIQNYSNYKLLIPRQHFNIIIKNILELIKINIDNIYLLEDNVVYNIKQFQKGSYYHNAPERPVEDHIWIFNKIREGLQISIPTQLNKKYRKIYLKRDGVSNDTHGNSETGIYRYIENDDLLTEKLIENGFEIIN